MCIALKLNFSKIVACLCVGLDHGAGLGFEGWALVSTPPFAGWFIGLGFQRNGSLRVAPKAAIWRSNGGGGARACTALEVKRVRIAACFPCWLD